jgi:hypothetical protein
MFWAFDLILLWFGVSAHLAGHSHVHVSVLLSYFLKGREMTKPTLFCSPKVLCIILWSHISFLAHLCVSVWQRPMLSFFFCPILSHWGLVWNLSSEVSHQV